MKTLRGGEGFGEAIIDGIHEAVTMKFRDNSRSIFIVVADYCPHGEEFHKEVFGIFFVFVRVIGKS